VVSTINQKIFSLMVNGLKYALKLLIQNVLNRIPFVDILDTIFLKLPRITDFEAFQDLLSLPHFDLTFRGRWLSFRFANLYHFQLPHLPTPGTVSVSEALGLAVICISLAAVVYALGALQVAVQTSWLMVKASALAVVTALLVCVVVLASFIREGFLNLGYEVEYESSRPALLSYACCMLVIVIGLLMSLASSRYQLLILLRRIRPPPPHITPIATIKGRSRMKKQFMIG
jgi:hypothetical protein